MLAKLFTLLYDLVQANNCVPKYIGLDHIELATVIKEHTFARRLYTDTADHAAIATAEGPSMYIYIENIGRQ